MAFVKLFIGCPSFQDQIDSAKAGVAIEHFGPTHLKRMFIALPPVHEQRLIVGKIEGRTAPFAGAIEATKRGIFLLRQYRTRLIGDVVTGKLDVGEAVARLPKEADELEPLDEVEADTDVENATGDLDRVLGEAEV